MVDDTAIEAIRNALGGEADEPVAGYVFGSVARGESRPDSDVDVAVLFRTVPAGTLDALALDLRDRLEARVGRAVDLTVLNAAPSDLVHRVLRDGVLVAEGDAAARVEFEVRARNEYFDLKPYLDEYRRTGVRTS
jgi:predicted nucleotidyltransferase